jgi:hypothetical protein
VYFKALLLASIYFSYMFRLVRLYFLFSVSGNICISSYFISSLRILSNFYSFASTVHFRIPYSADVFVLFFSFQYVIEVLEWV